MRKLLQNFNMWSGWTSSAKDAKPYHTITVNLDTPAIYLYPAERLAVQVKLIMRGQSVMTNSLPAYQDGWRVFVDPSRPYNRITSQYAPVFDNKPYGYLDYHAIRDGDWQEKEGWVVSSKDLREFLRRELTAIGCNETEVEDYIMVVPRTMEEKYMRDMKYVIYPQFGEIVDDSVALEVTPTPDAVYRLWLYFKEAPTKGAKPRPPKLPKIRRDGFHVVELGIVEDHPNETTIMGPVKPKGHVERLRRQVSALLSQEFGEQFSEAELNINLKDEKGRTAKKEWTTSIPIN